MYSAKVLKVIDSEIDHISRFRDRTRHNEISKITHTSSNRRNNLHILITSPVIWNYASNILTSETHNLSFATRTRFIRIDLIGIRRFVCNYPVDSIATGVQVALIAVRRSRIFPISNSLRVKSFVTF